MNELMLFWSLFSHNYTADYNILFYMQHVKFIKNEKLIFNEDQWSL